MAKGTLQIWLSEGSKEGEIILDYPSGRKLITWVLQSREISLVQDDREMVASEGALLTEKTGKGPWVLESGSLQERGKASGNEYSSAGISVLSQ